MNKLYSLVTLLLCVFFFGTKANAQTTTEDIPLTFCVNVSNPEICYAVDSSYQEVALQKGENVFTTVYHKTTYTDGGSYGYSDVVYLYVKREYSSDYTFTACNVLMQGETEAVPYEDFYGPSGNIAFSLVPEMDGCIFYPDLTNLESLRTATATVNVDDASNVVLRCGYYGYEPELVNGENIIKFNPEDEANWTVGPRMYGSYLGGVTVNGEEIAERYGTYDFYVTDGSVIDIIGAATLEPVTVGITFVNPDTEAAVKGVYEYVNYESVEIENWRDGFTVDKYTQIIISLDQNAYNVRSLTVNGNPEQLYSENVYITLTKDTQIVIDAEKYGTFDFTLTVTDPAHLDIGVAESMYSGMSALTGLVSGTQVLTVSDKNAYLIVSAIPGCAIDRVYYVEKGSSVERDVEPGWSAYYIPLTDIESVTIESHAMTRENQATLWINDINKCYVFSLKYADGNYIFDTYGDVPAVTGEQTFFFDAVEDNPVWLFFSPMDYDNPGYVMLNEEVIEPRYEGSTTYEFDIKDGDVIKVYLGETAPSTSITDITTNPAVQNSIYTITGVKVTNDTLVPGLYIINGKKVLVK